MEAEAAPAAGAAAAPPRKAPEQVVVHPLVLLSVVDHYNRVARDTRKRVVGVLLGESYKGRIDATNSFAGARRTARACLEGRASGCSASGARAGQPPPAAA